MGDVVCKFGGRVKENGNCTKVDDDGFAVQSVGPWVEDKHDLLQRYLEATHAVRSRFLGPNKGGAAFVDLFAGPGRVRIRNADHVQRGSALLAQAHQRAPFSHLVFCDLDEENVAALAGRTVADRRVTVLPGDCNLRIDDLVQRIPRDGLNIALIDPFGAKPLKWSTVEKLARFKRMDLLIHFPTNAIKRNFLNDYVTDFDDVIDALVGTEQWRERVRTLGEVVTLMDLLRERLVALGYDSERVRAIPITNTGGGLLYHLMFASKDRRGTEIWKSLARNSRTQRGFAFDE
ncbi:MAG: three-Cys-motif partner protein TcmP [Archangium sp.]